MHHYKLATCHRTLLTLAVDQRKVSVDAQRGHVLLWRTSQDSVQTFTFIQSQHPWAADLCYRLFLPMRMAQKELEKNLKDDVCSPVSSTLPVLHERWRKLTIYLLSLS